MTHTKLEETIIIVFQRLNWTCLTVIIACLFVQCTIHGNHIISIRTKPRKMQFVIIVHQHVDVAMLRIHSNERELKLVRPMQMNKSNHKTCADKDC